MMKEEWLNRAIVMKCSDEAFMRIVGLLKTLPDCYFVYGKSSTNKLVVSESKGDEDARSCGKKG